MRWYVRKNFLAHQIRISETLPWDRKSFLAYCIRLPAIFPGIKNLILPMLSYPEHQVTSACEIASKCIQGLLEAYLKINE